MKRLIINADDLGADPGRNKGIFEGIRAGVITSVSVLPNGPASQEAMEWLQKEGRDLVSIGLHLNLSEGRPLCRGMRRLVGTNGCFLGKEACRKLLAREGDWNLRKQVAMELEAQLNWALSWGVPISHINGHQHVHLLPVVLESMIGHARKAGISWVRLPLEEKPLVQVKKDSKLQAEARTFNKVAKEALEKLLGSGLRTPDFFLGLHWKGLISSRLLKEMLEKLPHGLAELMVHPGRVEPGGKEGPFSGFSGQEREKELEALLDEELGVMLKKYEVILSKFPEEEKPAWS